MFPGRGHLIPKEKKPSIPGMKKTKWILAIVGVASLVAGTVWASAALRLSFEQLVSESDRVVVAKMVEQSPSWWGPKNLRIYTEYTFEVEEELAGTGSRRFTVVQPGGRVGKLAQRTDGYPTYEKGTRLLLFLAKRTDSFRVVGLSQGVFGFHRDGNREILFQRLEGLGFPGDHGRPMLIERSEAFERIREIWSARKRVDP
jgi:hypothetical protein